VGQSLSENCGWREARSGKIHSLDTCSLISMDTPIVIVRRTLDYLQNRDESVMECFRDKKISHDAAVAACVDEGAWTSDILLTRERAIHSQRKHVPRDRGHSGLLEEPEILSVTDTIVIYRDLPGEQESWLALQWGGLCIERW
jgi:hypothetical protein